MARANLCIQCHDRPALLCRECMRAIAIIDRSSGFGGISRHPPEAGGRRCRICEYGGADYCPECWCAEAVSYREVLLTSPAAGGVRASVEDLDRQEREQAESAHKVRERARAAGMRPGDLLAVGERQPVYLSWWHAVGGG